MKKVIVSLALLSLLLVGCSKKTNTTNSSNTNTNNNKITNSSNVTQANVTGSTTNIEIEEDVPRPDEVVEPVEEEEIIIVDANQIFGKWATEDKKTLLNITSKEANPEEYRSDTYLLLSDDLYEFNKFRLEKGRLVVSNSDLIYFNIINLQLNINIHGTDYVLDRITDEEYNELAAPYLEQTEKIEELDIPEVETLDTTTLDGLWVSLDETALLKTEDGWCNYVTFKHSTSGEYVIGNEDGTIPNLLDINEQTKFLMNFSDDHLFLTDVFTNEQKEFQKVKMVEFTKYMLRDTWKPIKLETNEKIISLNGSRFDEAKKIFKAWNIKEEKYVCVGTRSNKYLTKSLGSDFNFDFRNSDFKNYYRAINYLSAIGLSSVKMGRKEEREDDLANCLDYAGLYADDYMDLVLFACCKFAIVTTSGMWQLPTFFGKNVLVVNATSYTITCGGIPYKDKDLYIPKKYYSKDEGRLLTLKEVIRMEGECRNQGEKLEERGIDVIENTPEEILEATKEMIMRLDGTWKDEDTDIINYNKYLTIMGEACKIYETDAFNYRQKEYEDPVEQVVDDLRYCSASWENRIGNAGGPIPCQVATSFLRSNGYWLK